MDLTFTWTDDTFAGTAPAQRFIGSIGGTAAPNNATSGGYAAGTLGVYYAFIQFAGFTIGKAVSRSALRGPPIPATTIDGLVGGGGTVTGVNQFTYTAEFGQGVSASIRRRIRPPTIRPAMNNVGAIGGSAFGALRHQRLSLERLLLTSSRTVQVDQAWGLFKASVAAHDNHAAYYAPALAPNLMVIRRQVWLGRTGGLVDQEHPDRTG